MVQPPLMTHRSQHTKAKSDVPKAQQTAQTKKRKRIAYITYKAPIITEEDVTEAMKVLQEAQDANADVIDIALDRIREFNRLWNHMKKKMLGYVFCRKGSLITFLATKTASKLDREVGKAFIQSEGCMATPGIDLWVLNTTCGPITIKRSDRR